MALLTTKLHIPLPNPNMVPRRRLTERLDEALQRSRRLTLVSAPAGFGKTTLLSEWVASCGRPTAWLSLDEGDNDPTRFWSYVIAALQTVHTGIGEMSLAMVRSSQPPAKEVFLTGLINDITGTATPFNLVLDDLHEITNQQVHDGLGFFVSNLPPQSHLVLCGRHDPLWPLARIRARGEMTELRAEDLRFTLEEAALFLNRATGLNLSPEDVTALEGRTEGWIAGLQMAAISMQGRHAEHVASFIHTFTGSHRFVLDYLVEEVLDRQVPALQEFLLKTAILERMSAPLCDALLGVGDSQQVLEQLEAANLFVVPLDDERRWYRYHHLFADLLCSRLARAQPDLVPALHQKASEWYEGAGLVEEAVAHALAGAALERAARLVEENAMQVIIDGNLPTVSRWLEALPEQLMERRPWLRVFQAWTWYWTGRRERVEECLMQAEQALESVSERSAREKRSEAPGLAEKRHVAGYIATIRAYSALTNDDIPRALDMAERAAEFLPEGGYVRSLAAIALGGARSARGEVAAAQQAYAASSAIAQACGYRSLNVSALTYLGMEQARQGRLRAARETFHQALNAAIGPGGRHLPVGGCPSVKLGDLAREWNDLETASRYLNSGVEACVQWGQADYAAEGYVALARLQLAQGDLKAACDSVQSAEQMAQRTRIDPFIRCWLIDCRLRLWLTMGDLAAAVDWTQASGLTLDGKLSYHHDLHHINLARVLVAQGRQQPSGPYLDDASGLLARLLEAAEAAGWVSAAIKILALQATALETSGDNERALAALARALGLAEAEGYVRTFVDEGAPMGRLLRLAATRGIAVDYATMLLHALGSEPRHEGRRVLHLPSAAGPMPAWPEIEPFTERELEVLRLLSTDLSTAEIAEQFVISLSTLRTHIKRIYGKLDVHSRIQAVARAYDLGLL